MAEVSTLTICEHTAGVNYFSGDYGIAIAVTPPSWFHFLTETYFLGSGDYSYNVDNNAPVGIHTIFINTIGSPFEPQNFITITITDCTHDDDIASCIGQFQKFPLTGPPSIEGDIWQIVSAPDWFTLNSIPFNHSYEFVPSTEGVFIIILKPSEPGYEEFTYQIKITVTNCFSLDQELCFAGSDNKINIAWLNRLGGWNSYIFSSKKIFGKDIGDNKIMKATGHSLKKISIENVFDSVIVPSGVIPRSHLDFVDEFKYTIQAYVFNDITALWDIPIIIDGNSFELRKEGEGFFKYEFAFKFAREILIQSQ